MSAGDIHTKKCTTVLSKTICLPHQVKELLQSQTEIARCLELCYLELRDFPEIAAEIRITAIEVHSQHISIDGLFKKWLVTACFVVNTCCPVMKKAVKMQDKDTVNTAFCEALEMCMDMNKEAEYSRNGYLKLGERTQKDLIEINKKKTVVTREQERRKVEKEMDMVFRNESERQGESEEHLTTQKERLESQIKKLTEDRSYWLKKSCFVFSLKENLCDVSRFMDSMSHLENMDKQVTHIFMCLNWMATLMNKMHSSQKADGVYLKKIEDERYSSKFLHSIEKLEKDWNNVAIACSYYATMSDAVKLYSFSSNPTDNYTEEQVKARKRVLKKEIIDELEHISVK